MGPSQVGFATRWRKVNQDMELVRRLALAYADSAIAKADGWLADEADRRIRIRCALATLRALRESRDQQQGAFDAGVGTGNPEYREILRYTEERIAETEAFVASASMRPHAPRRRGGVEVR